MNSGDAHDGTSSPMATPNSGERTRKIKWFASTNSRRRKAPEGAYQDYAHQDKPTTDSSHPVGPRAGARCCPVVPGPGLRLRPDIGGALS